ncbi:MAG: glycosyltransferase, partial [Verrucomicrobiaceae bacterium]
MKVFLSAYACEPDKGSEPGVGWNWAQGMADRVDLTVLTRESNRNAIQGAIARLRDDAPLRRVRFLYHDLSAPWLWAKRRGLLPTFAYYVAWQWSVARKFHQQADDMDIIHHLTFCTVLCPGFWRPSHAAFVIGPVGAPLVNEHYLPLFGKRAWIQRWRGKLMEHFLSLPWLDRVFGQAAAVIPANSETASLLTRNGIPVKEVMLDTGTPEVPEMQHGGRQEKPDAFRLIYAGRLERRKGLELSLRALARVEAEGNFDWRFDIVGDGPDRERLAAMTREPGLADKVSFAGSLPREEVMQKFQTADAFLFTSVRDTSGGVNLEAMACGLPVICIAHQGVGDITDEQCAERIPPA